MGGEAGSKRKQNRHGTGVIFLVIACVIDGGTKLRISGLVLSMVMDFGGSYDGFIFGVRG